MKRHFPVFTALYFSVIGLTCMGAHSTFFTLVSQPHSLGILHSTFLWLRPRSLTFGGVKIQRNPGSVFSNLPLVWKYIYLNSHAATVSYTITTMEHFPSIESLETPDGDSRFRCPTTQPGQATLDALVFSKCSAFLHYGLQQSYSRFPCQIQRRSRLTDRRFSKRHTSSSNGRGRCDDDGAASASDVTATASAYSGFSFQILHRSKLTERGFTKHHTSSSNGRDRCHYALASATASAAHVQSPNHVAFFHP